MKHVYRIAYWVGSMITECYIKAKSETSAIEAFKSRKGNFEIVSIELI